MPSLAIVGATGYSALELIELLLRHPHAQIRCLAARRDEGQRISDEFPQLRTRCDLPLSPIDPDLIAASARTAFLCLPNGLAMELAPKLLARDMKVIDLSADYRLTDLSIWEQTYRLEHLDSARVRRGEAVYGLPELFRAKIRRARLVANPGCYATAAALALAPLLGTRDGAGKALAKSTDLIVSAASGVSGAGREPKPEHHFPHRNESFEPYNVGVHRHQPEIEQTLSIVSKSPVSLLFAPHLVPMTRGILATCFALPADEHAMGSGVIQAFRDYYADEPFVRVRDDLPSTRDVDRTNFTDIAVRLAKGRIVVMSALDNLVKGAAGQAVQNFNLMNGLEETTGLR